MPVPAIRAGPVLSIYRKAVYFMGFYAHSRTRSSSSRNDEVRTAVQQATDLQLREFLIGALREDDRLFARFKSAVCPSVSRSDLERCKRLIDEAIRPYLEYDQYISYRDAPDFFDEMEDFLLDDIPALLQKGCVAEAFELTCYLFVQVTHVELDDSDGGMSTFIYQCIELWNDILEQADPPTEAQAYQWFTSYLGDLENNDMADFLVDLWMERFSAPAYLQDKLEFTARRAEAAQQDTGWYAEYEASKWVLLHITLMEEQGDSPQAVWEYGRQYWRYAQIREYFVDKRIAEKDYPGAISILEESLKLDTEAPGLIVGYHEKLKDLYQQTGNDAAYREQLWYLVTDGCPGQLDLFRELKALYPPEVWPATREKIFDAIASSSNKARLYEEEGLYDRLVDYVSNSFGLYEVQKYRTALKARYPQQLLQKYTAELDQAAACVSDRRTYQGQMDLLREMLEIEGGDAAVRAILSRWRVLYKRRRAMMEELEQLAKELGEPANSAAPAEEANQTTLF